MTELARYEDRDLAPVAPVYATDPTGGRLVAWASGLQAAHQIGSALCTTAFAPKHFAGKADEAAAAILFGDEIGLTPTQALRSIYVIGGAPALYARAMVALVMSHGHNVWTVEDTPTKVTVAGQRRGTKHVETVTWTTDRARKAGYTANKKYESDPQAMLYARAAGDVARRVAPDVLAGIAYTVEEMELEDTPTTTVKRDAEPTTKRTAKRQAVPEPDLDEPEIGSRNGNDGDRQPASDSISAEESTTNQPDFANSLPENSGNETVTDGVTAAQIKKLGVLFREAGMTERANALAYVGDTIGRQVASRNELTKDEASRVIDALERDMRPDAEPELPDPNDGNDPWAKGGAE